MLDATRQLAALIHHLDPFSHHASPSPLLEKGLVVVSRVVVLGVTPTGAPVGAAREAFGPAGVNSPARKEGSWQIVVVRIVVIR